VNSEHIPSPLSSPTRGEELNGGKAGALQLQNEKESKDCALLLQNKAKLRFAATK